MSKVESVHLRRAAYVYVRQSTMAQVERNTESLERQYELVDRAVALGWAAGEVVVVDRDLGRSAKSTDGREGFERLVADVGLGKVGLVLGIEVSRLARRNSDWYQLLDLCALTNTLIADADGVYHRVQVFCRDFIMRRRRRAPARHPDRCSTVGAAHKTP
jgi:DNA invertase Pin-like site-specific DNA recombinase